MYSRLGYEYESYNPFVCLFREHVQVTKEQPDVFCRIKADKACMLVTLGLVKQFSLGIMRLGRPIMKRTRNDLAHINVVLYMMF